MTDTAQPPSQQEINSMVSMIIVNLPFPPLPVCGVRGEGQEEEDAIVSGHDLLSRAIACTLLGSAPQACSRVVQKSAEEIQKYKAQMLGTMHLYIANIWNEKAEEEERVGRCYEVFCSTFRAYMRLYPGPDDLRILPLGAVDGKSVLCVQAAQHLAARNAVTEMPIKWGCEKKVKACAKSMTEAGAKECHGMRYYDVIKAYAVDLHTAGV